MNNLRHKFVDSNMNEQEIDINESTPEKNIEKYIQYQDEFFPVKIELITDDSKEFPVKLIFQKDNGLRHWTYAIIDTEDKIVF